MTDICAYITGDSEVPIWGLHGRERLSRMLRRVPGLVLADGVGDLRGCGRVLLVRGDYLFDARLIQALAVSGEDFVLLESAGGRAVAATVAAHAAEQTLRRIEAGRGAVPGVQTRVPEQMASGFQMQLRKHDAPRVFAIRAGNREQLESELFAGSYKGVTDLVTKWLWPLPAKWATRRCVRWGLLPNHVTLAGLVLAVLAGAAFWYGYFGTGLLLGWIMTFLDTVDGKLARVTVTSSRVGDVLDHGLDLVHPPLWYLAWGVGLGAAWSWNWPLETVLWFMFAGYLGGRLCEGAFQLLVAPFSMFVWRPFDSFNRLVTARRNPNLILLSIAWLAGRPDAGLAAVVAWHGISSLVLLYRVVYAWLEVRRAGPARTWLADVDPARDRDRIAVRTFTRVPAG